MSLVIRRYLFQEINTAVAAVTLILLLIASINQLGVYLAQVAQGELSVRVIGPLLALHLPQILGLLLPLSAYMGVLLVLGRLFSLGEIHVLMCCGMSWWQLCKQVFFATASVVAVVAVLQFALMPWASAKLEQRLANAQANATRQALLPGRFHQSEDGEHVFYVESVSKDGQTLRGLFLAEAPPASGGSMHQVVVGQQGRLSVDPVSGDQYLSVSQGARYLGIPGHFDYRVMRFKTYGLRLHASEDLGRLHTRSKPSLTLWASSEPRDNIEFRWRVAGVVSVLLLATLAVPLSYVAPKQNRYFNFILAMLIFSFYYNLLIINKAWLEEGRVPLYWGFGWIHGIFVLLAVMMVTLRQRLWHLGRLRGWLMRAS